MGEELRENEGSYRELFERAPVGLGVTDMNGSLLAFNDALLEPGAYTREDMLRLGNLSLLYASGADRERVHGIARERGFVWREKVQLRRKDGSSYEALLTLTPVGFRGRPCWHATVEEVSGQSRPEAGRSQREVQLQQAQKMEAVGRMTSGIAHDFKNLLQIIAANAELLGDGLDGEATELRRALEVLQTAAARGGAMIEKLLGFCRDAPLEVAPTDLAALMRTMRSTLRQVLPGGIALDVVAPEECVAAVDPGAMQQILMNLATNARDAMPEGGVLGVQVQRVSLDAEALAARSWMPAGEYARITVSDTGHGMDEATRGKAFEPFFTTKPVGAGTGLGLPMVFGLVKQQHGFIELDSALGRGTTVQLHFPAVARRPTVDRPPAEAGASDRRRVLAGIGVLGGSETILLIDDDSGLRDTATRVLQHLGYRVLAAADGVEGVDLYRRRRPEIDLVISDAVMPGLTGREVYEVLHQENPGVRFLLSSGECEAETRDVAALEHLPLVRKPWTIGEIARQVREALDS
jgi:two-component system cell cycle sensor histidine kinase/response regulator CckA